MAVCGRSVPATRSPARANRGNRPILTPKTVLPLFFLVGVIFAPIGALLLYASSLVQEISIDYTTCLAAAPNASIELNTTAGNELKNIPASKYSATFNEPMSPPQWGKAVVAYTYPSGKTADTNVCILSINIPKDIKPPVLLYYRLTNFYQNHRRYVKSIDTNQLKGRARSAADIQSGDCGPVSVAPNGKPYYPCGLIANSMFNDTFGNFTAANAQGGGDETQFYNMTVHGTSWSHEGDLYGKSEYQPADVVPPPFWQDQYVNGSYEGTELPNLHTWEQFQVWMRTAGLPTFSKLAQRNDTHVMKAGTYRLSIYDRRQDP